MHTQRARPHPRRLVSVVVVVVVVGPNIMGQAYARPGAFASGQAILGVGGGGGRGDSAGVSSAPAGAGARARPRFVGRWRNPSPRSAVSDVRIYPKPINWSLKRSTHGSPTIHRLGSRACRQRGPHPVTAGRGAHVRLRDFQACRGGIGEPTAALAGCALSAAGEPGEGRIDYVALGGHSRGSRRGRDRSRTGGER